LGIRPFAFSDAPYLFMDQRILNYCFNSSHIQSNT